MYVATTIYFRGTRHFRIYGFRGVYYRRFNQDILKCAGAHAVGVVCFDLNISFLHDCRLEF